MSHRRTISSIAALAFLAYAAWSLVTLLRCSVAEPEALAARATGYGLGYNPGTGCTAAPLNTTCGDGGAGQGILCEDFNTPSCLSPDGVNPSNGVDPREFLMPSTLQGLASFQTPPYNTCMNPDALSVPGDGYLHIRMINNTRTACPMDFNPRIIDAAAGPSPYNGSPYSATGTIYDIGEVQSRLLFEGTSSLGVTIEYRMRKAGPPVYPTDGMWGFRCYSPSHFAEYNLGGSFAGPGTYRDAGGCNTGEVQQTLSDGAVQFPGQWSGEFDGIDQPQQHTIELSDGGPNWVEYTAMFTSLAGITGGNAYNQGTYGTITPAQFPQFNDPRLEFFVYKIHWGSTITMSIGSDYDSGITSIYTFSTNVFRFPVSFNSFVETLNWFTDTGARVNEAGTGFGDLPESLYDYIRIWCDDGTTGCIRGYSGDAGLWDGG